MENPLANLKTFQKIEFILMTMLAIAIPFHWFAAQIFEVLLTVFVLAKVIFFQKFHFNDTQMRWKWVYFTIMATWFIYLIGMIYTQNTDYGWVQVSKKLGFLIFPLIFMVSDMSYLTKNRVRFIFYAFVASLLIFFIANLLWATWDVVFKHASLERFLDSNLMKLYYLHHSYLSMYVGLAIAFCVSEFFECNNKRLKIIDLTAILLFIIFTMLLESRAGIICLVLIFFVLLAWITFVKKGKKIGLKTGIISIVVIIAAIIAFPSSIDRIAETIDDVNSEYASDHRLVQFKGYRNLLHEKWLTGVGTGDRMDEIMRSYNEYKTTITERIKPSELTDIQLFKKNRQECLDSIMAESMRNIYIPYEETREIREYALLMADKYGCDKADVNQYLVEYMFINYAIDKNINAHNQYFETIIAVGIVGLLLMLACLAIPIFVMFKQKTFDVVYIVFIVIIAFNALFESIFEGQMGIIFFNFFNMLLFNNLITNNKVKLTNEK